jgi:hypothetical protein
VAFEIIWQLACHKPADAESGGLLFEPTSANSKKTLNLPRQPGAILRGMFRFENRLTRKWTSRESLEVK